MSKLAKKVVKKMPRTAKWLQWSMMFFQRAMKLVSETIFVTTEAVATSAAVPVETILVTVAAVTVPVEMILVTVAAVTTIATVLDVVSRVAIVKVTETIFVTTEAVGTTATVPVETILVTVTVPVETVAVVATTTTVPKLKGARATAGVVILMIEGPREHRIAGNLERCIKSAHRCQWP